MTKDKCPACGYEVFILSNGNMGKHDIYVGPPRHWMYCVGVGKTIKHTIDKIKALSQGQRSKYEKYYVRATH